MKVLHLSTSDIEGGAARSAYRLHQGLANTGIDSQMLVRVKQSTDKAVIREKSLLTKLGPVLSGLPLRLASSEPIHSFGVQWFQDAILSEVSRLNPDIVNLHWILNGYLRIETLSKLNKPLLWTLHDMWTFTGGCQYSWDCNRYTEACGACPQLRSRQDRDLSRWVWRRKQRAWKAVDLTLVAPSQWMAQSAASSSLLRNRRVECIPYGIDTQRYRPIDPFTARILLRLPTDRKLILFGSMSPNDGRKGFQFLQPALKRLSQNGWGDRVDLLVLGETQANHSLDLGLHCHYLGRFNDDISLALLYSAVDLFAAPSAQDNLPNTVMEALACGTPCIGFKIGGVPDMIEHQQNGYLAQPYEIEDLAQGVAWILEDSDRHQRLRHRAREKVEQEFPLALQAQRYLRLYHELLEQSARAQQCLQC